MKTQNVDRQREECVKVVVRIRPLSSSEQRDGHIVIAEASEERGEIIVRDPDSDEREPPKTFTFDAVFGFDVTQRHIYDVCAAPLVESVLNGYNGTIFAYGQTGAGKTHTMEGFADPPELRGIIPNSFQHIFDRVAISENLQFLVRASYMEIYNEEVRDLLSRDPANRLELKESVDAGVYVKDLTSLVVKNVNEIDHVMQAGKKNRTTGATLMNLSSSRSHAIFSIVIECCDLNPPPSSSNNNSKKKESHIRVGKLNLVDLAGSERQSKTGATGDRLKEATKINLSLSALGNVISALVDGKSQHVPYRDSKLTRLLQDSLGGNTKTVMCANCGPAGYNYDETLSTLRYANRAKNIKNKPKINEDPKDAMLREFQDEIKRLRAQLNDVDNSTTGVASSSSSSNTGDMKQVKDQAEAEKRVLIQRAASDMKMVLDQQKMTMEEKEELKAKLDDEEANRRVLERKHKELERALIETEQKVIHGGELKSRSERQEAMLRQAQVELEERRQQEMRMARELACKAEATLQMEEQYTSLQDEADVKTKKLKKLWQRLQTANREVKDLTAEFQREREDLTDSIRDLTMQLKLKDAITKHFIPAEYVTMIESRARWVEEDDDWLITKCEFGGNHVQVNKSSCRTRGEVRLARSTRQAERDGKVASDQINLRYASENVLPMALDVPDRNTQEYEGSDMVMKVQRMLAMSLHDNGDDDRLYNHETRSTFLTYPSNNDDDDDTKERKSDRPRSSRKSRK